MLGRIFIVIDHRGNSHRVNMHVRPDNLCWFWLVSLCSYPFILIRGEATNTKFKTLVCLDRGSNPSSAHSKRARNHSTTDVVDHNLYSFYASINTIAYCKINSLLFSNWQSLPQKSEVHWHMYSLLWWKHTPSFLQGGTLQTSEKNIWLIAIGIYCSELCRNQMIKRLWRYQRGNHNPLIEGQATQWPKGKGQTIIYKTYT